MIKKPIVVCFCVFVYILNEVNAKFCERTEAISRMVEVTSKISYRVTYHGQCYYGCIKTRWETTVRRTYVPKTEFKSVKCCCSGYIRIDDSSSDSDIVCEPICMPACKNGHCKAPGECACDTGYIPDPNDTHNCLPLCEKCDHGACVAPNTCRCNFGYNFVNTTCQPVCTDPCHNGTCTAPETCECLSGYRKSDKNVCEPYCFHGCSNGFCAAPENCSCNPGWRFKYNKLELDRLCEPICSKSCGNAVCVAPDTCECIGPLYKTSNNGICEPVCSPACGNGTCVQPDTCICFPGYHVKSNRSGLNETVCSPTCIDCDGEYCVAPNKCKIRDTVSPEPQAEVPQSYDEFYDEYSDDYYEHEIFPKTKTIFIKPTIENVTNNCPTEMTDSDENTLSYETTKTTKYLINTRTQSNDTITNDTTAKRSTSWLHQHWISIFIPLLVIVTAAIIMLLVWRWAPIIVFFKGRSYVVEGEPMDHGEPRPFEDIQISAINEKDKAVKNNEA